MTAKITSVVLAILSILLLSTVFVPSFVEVTPGRVTLFNLAATYTEATELLDSIVLAYLPEGTHTLSASYIESMAKRKGIEVSFESSVVTIYATGSIVEGEEEPPEIFELLASSAMLDIASDVGCPASDATYEILQISGNASSDVTYRYFKLGKGKFSVLGKSEDGYAYLLLDVKCYKEVPVAAKLIKYGEIIKPEFVILKKVNVLSMTETPASTQDVYYARALRMFKPGDVITQEGIKRKPDVVKGQIILAYVELPGLKITAFVEALQDAYIGEVLRARNVKSGKIVMGVLEEGPVLKVVEVKER